MNLAKRCMTLALALSVLAGAGAPAAVAAQTAREKTVLKSVYECTSQEFWPHLDQVVVLEKDVSLKAKDLPETQRYVDTAGREHTLDLTWDVKDADLKKPGLQKAEGTPDLPRGMTLAEGFDGKVTWPVFRKGKDAVLPVKAIQPHGLEDILIAQDSEDPLSELTITTSGLRYGAGETGYILSTEEWKWEWDLSKVDTAVTGKATVTGTLKDQPDWIRVDEADRTAEHTVYVLPADSIQLIAPTDLSEEGKLTFQWIYDSKKVTEAVLEMEKDGQWTACDESWYTYQKPTEEEDKDNAEEGSKAEDKEEDKEEEALPAALILDLTKFPVGDYTLRLNYVDEASGEAEEKTTDDLYLTIPEKLDELLEEAEGKIPPELKLNEKPAEKPDPQPDPEEESRPEAEIPKDIITDTYSTLSGKSLAEQIAKGKTVLFEKKKVSLEIPSQLLADLKLKDTDLITVAVTVPKTGTVQVSVNAGGKVITNLKGSVVKMDYSLAKNKTLTCKDLTGKLSPKVTYSEKDKTASFPINQAGTYTLTVKAVSTTTNKKPATTVNKTTTTKKPTTVSKPTTTQKPTVSSSSGGAAAQEEVDLSYLEGFETETYASTGAESPAEDGAAAETFTLAETTGEKDDAPRTWWDEQTPTALALMAAMGLLVAAGILLRKWFSE